MFKKTTKAQPFHELEASGTPASLSTLKEFFFTTDRESDDQERSQMDTFKLAWQGKCLLEKWFLKTDLMKNGFGKDEAA